MRFYRGVIVVIFLFISKSGMLSAQPRPLYPILHDYAKSLYRDYKTIPEERRFRLEAIADFILQSKNYNRIAEIIYVGTNQSTRSQMAQIWSYAAAHYYGVDNVKFYSGGLKPDVITENTVTALERAGFIIYNVKQGDRNFYQVKYSFNLKPIIIYPKEIDERNNPPAEFMAVVVCSNVAQNLPVIKGTFNRLELTYYDPSGYDGLDEEKEEYDKVCREIALEIFYLFSLLKHA